MASFKILKFRKKKIFLYLVVFLLLVLAALYHYDKKTREREEKEDEYSSIFGDLDIDLDDFENSAESMKKASVKETEKEKEKEKVTDGDGLEESGDTSDAHQDLEKKLTDIIEKMKELEGRLKKTADKTDDNDDTNGPETNRNNVKALSERVIALEKELNQKQDQAPPQVEFSCREDEVYSPHCKTCMNKSKIGSQRLHYVHIPKAAGSSFSVPLRHYFDCEPAGKGCWGDPKNTVNGNIDCGGKLIGCYGIIPHTQKHSVTMMREPVSRLISAYSDGKQYPAVTPEEKTRLQDLSLLEYSQFPGVSNCQTKMMIGKSCTDKNPLTEFDLQKAKLALTSLDFFGLQEYYTTSVCLFFKTLGGYPADTDFQFVKRNIKYSRDIPETVRKSIESTESYDIELYQKAKTMFLENVKKKGLTILD